MAREVPGHTIPQSQFDGFLNDVVHAINLLVSSSSVGRKTPRQSFEMDSGGLRFRSSQETFATKPLTLGHMLAAVRTIQAENGRVGGGATVEIGIYSAPSGRAVRVGSGAVDGF